MKTKIYEYRWRYGCRFKPEFFVYERDVIETPKTYKFKNAGTLKKKDLYKINGLDGIFMYSPSKEDLLLFKNKLIENYQFRINRLEWEKNTIVKSLEDKEFTFYE